MKSRFVLIVAAGALFLSITLLLPRSDLGTNVRGLTSNISSAIPSPSPASQIPTEWRKYTNQPYDFSFWHPNELRVSEYDEGNNSKTFVFEDKTEGRAFQMFITPYTENQITQGRFEMDEPSGVIESQQEVVVGGTERGLLFFGQNTAMGDTREVWFIHRGFLYEVTTERESDEWLSGIMATWTFL